MKLSSPRVQSCADLFQRVSFAQAREETGRLLKKPLSSPERIEATALLLRIEMEFDDCESLDDRMNLAKETLLSAKKEKLVGALYHLGIVFLLLEDNELAEEAFSSASIWSSDELSRQFSSYGIIAVLNNQRKIERALEQLSELQANDLSPDLRCLTLMLEGNVFRKVGKYDRALESYTASQKCLPFAQAFYMKNWLYFGLGTLYARLGDLSKSRTHFEVVQSITHPIEFKRLYRLVTAEISRLDWKVEVLFDETTGDMTYSHGLISFRRKPILVKMLSELVRRSPSSVAKDTLYQSVWGEGYHPLRHDNLLYNHVQRLRTLLGEDTLLREMILTTGEGYRINPSILIRLKEQENSHEK